MDTAGNVSIAAKMAPSIIKAEKFTEKTSIIRTWVIFEHFCSTVVGEDEGVIEGDVDSVGDCDTVGADDNVGNNVGADDVVGATVGATLLPCIGIVPKSAINSSQLFLTSVLVFS
mmetsp:Transcript_25169/g.37667  ORF Transcript_25169/g.37667 Transcript_25169/m.37667 type:complete len:115 (-) Transcript_25169:417-761(-)